MTVLVLDTGAALRASASSAVRDALADVELIAPPLLWSEVTSALHEALWRDDIDRAAAAQTRRAFRELEVRRDRPARLYDVAWELAEELGWAKTYDAEFIALARIRHARVLTTDARLRRGADRTGLVLDPGEL